jgi:predicted phosphodiesterase
MRILIISDIHANQNALDAVLVDAGEFDAAWCLGDLVGYGPDPNECVDRVRALPDLVCIIGNHDAATLNQIDSETFNPEARQAIRWTQAALTDANLSFLRSLPERVNLDHVTLAHGSPRHPVWEYLLDTQNATRSFEYFESPYCFVGHTHLPSIYYMGDNNHSARLLIPEANTHLMLSPRAILNPGSVGQPRDRDPRAAYAIYTPDEEVWEYKRIAYDVISVQNRMKSAGLPERHIQRLTAGW